MTTSTQEPKTGAEVLDLALDLCMPHPGNKARPLDEPFLQSLRDKGQVVIALVRPHPTEDGKYEIINGARRRAGLEAIGSLNLIAEVREVDDQEAEELRAIENKQRVGLTWRQELEQIEEYLARYPEQFSSIAGALGISVNQVKRRQGLLKKLSKSWLKAIKTDQFPLWTVDHFESFFPFDEGQQEGFYDDLRFDENLTLKELRETLSENTHVLKLAKWDLSDATLCPEAGACTECPKRTGANADLFEDVDPKVKTGDRCLDQECWKKKGAAWLGMQIAVAKEAHPDLVMLDKEYTGSVGRIHADNTKKAKKTDKGAIPMLVMSGAGLGSVEYRKPKPGMEERVESAQRGNKKTMEEKKAGRERQRDALAVKKLIAIIEDEAKELDFHPYAYEVMVQYCLAFGVTVNEFQRGEEKRVMAFAEKPFTEAELWEAVSNDMDNKLSAEIRSYTGNPGTMGRSPVAFLKSEIVQLCAWMVDADYKELRREALAELPDPKSWAAEKEEAKVGKGKKKAGKKAKPEEEEDDDLGDEDDSLDGDSEGDL